MAPWKAACGVSGSRITSPAPHTPGSGAATTTRRRSHSRSTAPPRRRGAQQWARAVFEDAPPLLRWVVLFGWRFFLGLRLQPLDATDQILGWKLEPGAAGTDAVTLAADSPLLRAENIVAADDTVVLWVTVVHFENRAGRLLWTVASALHHLVIPYLLGRAARFRTGDETPFADPDKQDLTVPPSGIMWARRRADREEHAMGSETRGVVAKEKGAPVTLETILVPDPGPGEAVVAVQACGVCHTDLHYREGGINDDFPFLLGHEAAGVVEAVGDGVTDVAPGDFVVLNWRAVCGECRACRRGRPWYCFATHNATQKMTLADGTPLSPALGIGAFADRTLVAAGQCTKVDPAARPEAVGLLGCGVMAGIGAAMYTGEVGLGDSVAVFGCGGVGCAAVAGSKLAGAAVIIAVDLDPGKLELATEFGATHTVDASAGDPVEAIKGLTGGNGADVCIEAVGHPAVMEQAFLARDLAGTLVQVGVPTPDMRIDLPMIEFFGRGGALKPSWYGDCLPSRDFPMLVDLYVGGRLDLDRFVSETIGIDQVEDAFARMQRGEVLRSVVVL